MNEILDSRAIVAAGYDAVADRYAALECAETAWPRMRWLERLLCLLDDDSRVLDVGCGNGVPATRAIAARHRATGVDVSAAQIARARMNVPDAELIHGDLTAVDLDHGFEAIAAFYVVEHVPREQHAVVFERFCDWLAPGGYLLFTIEPDDQPPIVGEWLGAPMFFNQHEAEVTLALVREAGFEIVDHARETQLEGERPVDYLWVLARKAAPAAGGG